MAILPLQLARVSTSLRATLSQRTLTQTQTALLNVQNQLSTGKRISVPSDDPGGAAITAQLRKTLEQRQAYTDNLRAAGMQLSEVDTSLETLTDLLRQAQQVASENAGSLVTADQRAAAATAITALYNQALSVANRELAGAYLFGGDKGVQPFVPDMGGVRFAGSSAVLQNAVDVNMLLPLMINGGDIFGATSTAVGGMDLQPNLSGSTRLADLGGADEQGIRRGSLTLSNGVDTATVDLSEAETVGDVINLINAAGVGGITASIAPDGNSLALGAAVADQISVVEHGGTVAADLGILQITPLAAGATLDGQDVRPQLTAFTRLSDLNGGAGIDQASGFVINNGVKSVTIDVSSAVTVEDLLNQINGAGVGALARISADGRGIEVVNAVQGLTMTLGENGGTAAGDLGIRSFAPSTNLSQLNGGRGVATVSGADIQITRRDGTSFQVDLSGLSTVQDVIDAINAADGGAGLTASFATTGNGIVLSDATGGAGTLSVVAVNFSTAAADLGISGPASGATLTGSDVNGMKISGVFANLAALRDALLHSDEAAITTAAEGLQTDLNRVILLRGQAGALVQDIEARQQRLEDQNFATESLLSSLEDTDYNEAIARFQTLQTALEANLQTTGRLLGLSLLDYL